MQSIETQRDDKNLSELFANHTAHYLYTYYLSCLIKCTQHSSELENCPAEQIAAEIASISHNAIQLYLYKQPALNETMVPYIANHRPFLVRWNKVTYGSLQCLVHEETGEMILPASLCERLACDCGWCLYVLEKENYIQQQRQLGNEEAQKKIQSLSNAQYTVLQFMVKGYSTRAIADALHLSKRTVETHQHGIYQEFDVHSQREAILVGLAAGLSASG